MAQYSLCLRRLFLGMEASLHAFLFSTLDGGKEKDICSGVFIPGKTPSESNRYVLVDVAFYVGVKLGLSYKGKNID
jgi:hypothetical protein